VRKGGVEVLMAFMGIGIGFVLGKEGFNGIMQ
jgi:hypothetical protein